VTPPTNTIDSDNIINNSNSAFDRAESKWEYRNPNWYPDKVKNNNTPELTSYINNFQNDIHKTLTENETKFWNNLSTDERKALKDLSTDKSIIIKPADKGGAIVIMNAEDYEKVCLDHLADETFYEQLTNDPTPVYKDEIATAVNEMHANKYVTDFEKATMLTGERTPNFYGLPKIHKDYNNLPTIRPISSGSSGPSAASSEFVDTFLKPIAQKQPSYVKDTTDFINRTKSLKVGEHDHLVTMDVTSLYTNIDQEEGRIACESFLNLRLIPSIPTKIISNLIRIILSCNTMFFNGKFFHQIKGTAMGSSMAVNFANLFMSDLETKILDDYEKEHGLRPTCWLRYIDDIFFVWVHGETKLKHFLQFCNSYTEKNKMKSSIKFTANYSRKQVAFLDVMIKSTHQGIITDVHTKPTSAQNYLHRSSFHPPSLIRSIPKTQFIRLRRICTKLIDYDRNCQDFIQHFMRRGYAEKSLRNAAAEVRLMEREDLLTYKPKSSQQKRTILSVKWHPKFRHFPSILRQAYNTITATSSKMKEIFPHPPMVAFRRNRTTRNVLVHSRHGTPPQSLETQQQPAKPNRSFIAAQMNDSGTITSSDGSKTFKTAGGSCTQSNVIYAAECTRHNLLYVGQTSTPLNTRFNGHRSDISKKPESCQLPKHFSKHGCSFQNDLKVTILENNLPNEEIRTTREDMWITRLKTLTPKGLNTDLHEYGRCFYKLP